MMNTYSGAVSRSHPSGQAPAGLDASRIDRGEFSTSLDTALEATGYTKADAIFREALTVPIREQERFDALMRQFRATTKHWRGQ